MIKCIAIDDEPLALRQLAAYLDKVPYFEVVGRCQSAGEAAAVMSEQTVDAMFLDINMPDLNGLDFVRSLAHPPIVVLTTAYQEYAIDGYKVDAIDYVLKPFGMSDIMKAAEKVKRQHALLCASEQTGSSSAAEVSAGRDNALFFKMEHKVVKVSLPDIVYVEGMSEYVRIHLQGDRPLVVLYAMKRLEERLGSKDFMRIHKSYIICLHHISMVNKNGVTLDTGEQLPVGGSYKEKFSAYVRDRFCRNQ